MTYLVNDLGCTSVRIRRDPKLIDMFLLLKAIIDGSLPKLLFIDIKIFQHICEDIFPDVPAPQLSNKYKMKETIEQDLIKNDLCVHDDLVQNVLSINSAMQSRHGIMCIGPPISGKTTAIRTLITALQKLHDEEHSLKARLFQQKKAQM